MKFKKHESGRSMVEMLGVLAIIGVLSVGGIAGYSLSMRRHRANGVVDLASKYALVAYNQCMQKFLDGEITPGASFCREDKLLSFENAGVGALPAGVTKIRMSQVILGSDIGYDMVDLEVEFTDQKLCQAVASIAGTSCDKDGTNYSTEINIKQN